HPRPSPWDLRNRRGGLVDIEFIVQYLILRDAPQIAPCGIAAAIEALPSLPPRAVQELGVAVRLLRHVGAAGAAVRRAARPEGADRDACGDPGALRRRG